MINAKEVEKIKKDEWKEQAKAILGKNEKKISDLIKEASKEDKKTIDVTFLFEGQNSFVREELGKLFEKHDYFFIEKGGCFSKRRFMISWDFEKYEEEEEEASW